MENNFNNKIKQSFEGYELPYDPAAWNNLSKQLDVRMPVKSKITSKFWIAALVIAVLSISTIIYFTSNNTTKKSLPSENKEEINSSPTSQTRESSSDIIGKKTTSESTIINEKVTLEPITIENSKVEKLSPQEISSTEIQSTGVKTTTNPDTKTVNAIPIIPQIKNVCFGDDIEISNANKADIFLILPNGKSTNIKAGTKTSFKSGISGEYLLGYMKNEEFIQKDFFTVYPANKVDFTIDNENIYSEGIPAIGLKATTNAASYSWDFEKLKEGAQSKETEVHYYKAGTYKITLTTTSENGCKNSETSTLTVKEDYNLMAANTIDVSNSNSQINTFMPYALTVRNVKFVMTIIDANSNEIVFQTGDATQAWDGTDKRTGNTTTGTTFIWKVTISNPQPGETANYKGVITRL